MRKGKVRFYDEAKGVGYIIEEGRDEGHMVHRSGLIDPISEGDFVEFELEGSDKGIIAVNVKVVG